MLFTFSHSHVMSGANCSSVALCTVPLYGVQISADRSALHLINALRLFLIELEYMYDRMDRIGSPSGAKCSDRDGSKTKAMIVQACSKLY